MKSYLNYPVTYLLCVIVCALTPISLTAYPQGYSFPPNWELRTHPNGELYYVYIPDGIEEEEVYPLVLGLHGCCWDNITPEGAPPDPIYAAFHGFEANEQREPTFILTPYSANAWINKATNVMEILEDIREDYPIDSQRIILTGFSMGGAGGIQYLNAYPDTFAGAILVAIALNNTGSLNLNNFINVPIWGGVGSSDSWKVQMENVFTELRNINGHGNNADPNLYGVLPRYSVFEDAGHGPAMEGLFGMTEVIDWAYALRKDGNNMPTVQFVSPSPVANALLEEGTTSVTFLAEASDPGGSIQSAQFYLNGTPFGDVLTSPPFQATFTDLSAGDHTVSIIVTDNGVSQGYAINKINEDRRTFSIQAPLVITTDTLPAARVGSFYRFQIEASGQNGLASWIQTGSPRLPRIFTLSSAGIIEGVPTEVGEYPFIARVIDSKLEAVTKELILRVLPASPNQPILKNLSARGNSRAEFIPWIFAVGEPYGTAGYGQPVGSYRRTPHPYYDGLWNTGNIEDGIFLRVADNGVAIQSTGADWITFESDLPVRVHVAYQRTLGDVVPAWLETEGFVATGDVFEVYFKDFIDYVKDFPAGLVSIPGNEGDITGADSHYLLIVEPDASLPSEYLWPVDEWSGNSEDPVATWMGDVVVFRDAYPWVFHMNHGWLYLFGDTASSVWWYSSSEQFWWTNDSVYPWMYRWPSGWWYYLEGTAAPALYYDVAEDMWVELDNL